jgi:hypothetical protein
LISLPLELQPVFASSNASSMQPANAKSEDTNVKLWILRERFPQGCECTLSFVVIPSKCCCGDLFWNLMHILEGELGVQTHCFLATENARM